MNEVDVLIPCKFLADGKTRLAPCLSPEARKKLCRSFLVHAIEATRALSPRRIAVISADPEVSTLANTHGVLSLMDPGNGLNAALEHGRDVLFRNSLKSASFMILPIDLPCANSNALCALQSYDSDIVVAPDRAEIGTNLLLMSPAAAGFPFQFGPNSFVRHCDAARERGLSLTVVRDNRLTFDIDEPEDYLQWSTQT
jgi:2-phospho-L-lactate guanylyltransferase